MWAADITYVPMAHGFMYLVAIIDVVQPLGAGLAAVEHADAGLLRRGAGGGAGEVRARRRFSTPTRGRSSPAGRGSTPLKAAGVAISMDGKGRWIDNVFIERLWRSVKYEDVYLQAYETGSEARQR